MKKKLHALFSGRVQGVGFRFTAERIARRFPVTGYVRNLPHEKVELVAEGEEESLKQFLETVREAFRTHIHRVETHWCQATDEHRSFGIKF